MALYLGTEKYNVNQYADGVEDGKKSQYDELWDNIQQKGLRTNYAYFFQGWTASALKPKYSVKPTGSIHSMFSNDISQYSVKMKELEEELRIEFDFSGVNASAQHAFRNCIFSELNNIDFSNVTDITQTFVSSSTTVGIVRIETLKFNNTVKCYGQPFQNCNVLEYVGFEGTFDTEYTVSLSSCTKLFKESILKLINCLKDHRETGTKRYLTLGTTNLGKLTEQEIAIATEKGWTLT